jgi:hypothetical protein
MEVTNLKYKATWVITFRITEACVDAQKPHNVRRMISLIAGIWS